LEKESYRVLDVGCGTGELVSLPLRYYLQDLPQLHIVSIDPDATSIGRAQETVAHHGVTGIRFEVKLIDDVEEQFDCVMCCEVIEHLEDPQGFIRRLVAPLVEEGPFLLTVPNGYGYKETEQRLLRACKEMARQLPAWIRERLRRVHGKLSGMLNSYLRWGKHSQSRTRIRRPVGSLDIHGHIQFFTLGRLMEMLRKEGLQVEQVVVLSFLAGIFGTLVERWLGLHELVSHVPTKLGSNWALLCRKQQGQCRECVTNSE